MRAEELLCPGPAGLYSPLGDFYIDPTRPVPRALITHGHSDHARAGHTAVLATPETLAIMAARYGQEFAGSRQPVRYGETVTVNGVSITFRPAGHVLGSAQIVVEANGLRIVASGDYKTRSDPTCAPFEPVRSDIFITEATFGLPVFHHPLAADEIARLIASTEQFPERTHLVGAYSLGKAQRVIKLLRLAGYDRPIYIHGALVSLCRLYEEHGIALGELAQATDNKRAKAEFAGAIVIGPPGSFNDRWSRRFADPIVSFASGWMRIRQRAKQGGVELPLVISDHADWGELTATIRETGAGEVWVTHGREEALVRWCALNGIAAKPLHLVGYEDEEAEMIPVEIARQLITLGVEPGGVLLVHTSFRAVRPVEGGPAGLIEALRLALGADGTLVIPSWTGDDSSVFDPSETAASEDLGIMADTFWRLPGVLRSDHPFAFAAAGPRAAEIVAGELPLPPHIHASPVGHVYDLDGQVLLLGVGQDANTTVHLAELMAPVPYAVPHDITVLRDGRPQRITYGENDHCCQRFALMDDWLRARGLQKEGPVGHGQARLARSRDIVAVALEHLAADRLVFLHPAEAGCAECDAARESVGA